MYVGSFLSVRECVSADVCAPVIVRVDVHLCPSIVEYLCLFYEYAFGLTH